MDYKEKYLKYKQKYLNCKINQKNNQQYKTKYIQIIDEVKKEKCGNVLERLFEDKIKCQKNYYCECETCKQKKETGKKCKHDYECESYNCESVLDENNKPKQYGNCSSQISILKDLFLDN